MKLANQYKQYTVLDNMLLIEMTLDDLDKKERDFLALVKNSVLKIPPNASELEEIRRKAGALTKGKIVAMGDGAFLQNQGVSPKIGDVVIFKRYSQKDIDRTDDSEHWIALLQDIDVWLIEAPVKGK